MRIEARSCDWVLVVEMTPTVLEDIVKPNVFGGRDVFLVLVLSLCAMGLPPSSSIAAEQSKFVVTPLAEKKVAELPAGELYWQVENFPTRAEAEAAAGPTSLVAEAEGKVWLFTLGSKGAATGGGTKVVEIGPQPRIKAPSYLLRINGAIAPPGAKTKVHTHPGPEAFYVLSGELTQKTPEGVIIIEAGGTKPGKPDTPMEVSSSGATDLHELIMFFVDATRPFSSPATLN